MPNGHVFDQDGRVFESHRVINTQLSIIIGSHRVQIVIVGDEACVTVASGNLPDGDVVRAELWEGVHLVSSQCDSKAKLPFVVSTPRENFCVLIVISLDVHNAFSWRTAARSTLFPQGPVVVAYLVSRMALIWGSIGSANETN